MYESVAIALVTALQAYALFGALFAVAFVTVGISRLDPAARGSKFTFRMLVFPGAAALWPLLLSRWARDVHEPPLEGNPHR